jgi:hypothetical protein
VTVVVQVDAGSSGPSRSALSFTPPAISSITIVPGPDQQQDAASTCSTSGGTRFVFSGTNLGPGAGTRVEAVGVPNGGNPRGLAFPATNCTTLVPHTSIECVAGPGVGASLLWRVRVGGVEGTVPVMSYGGPVVTGVVIGPSPHAPLSITGSGFGHWAHTVNVTVAVGTPPTIVIAAECAVQDTVIDCVVNEGSGRVMSVAVAVLDQSVAFDMSSANVFLHNEVAAGGVGWAGPAFGSVGGVVGLVLLGVGLTVILRRHWNLQAVSLRFPDIEQSGMELGKGAQGVVWKARWHGADVAVKELRTEV